MDDQTYKQLLIQEMFDINTLIEPPSIWAIDAGLILYFSTIAHFNDTKLRRQKYPHLLHAGKYFLLLAQHRAPEYKKNV